MNQVQRGIRTEPITPDRIRIGTLVAPRDRPHLHVL